MIVAGASLLRRKRQRVLLASGLEPTEHTLEIRVSDKIKAEDTVRIYAVLVN